MLSMAPSFYTATALFSLISPIFLGDNISRGDKLGTEPCDLRHG